MINDLLIFLISFTIFHVEASGSSITVIHRRIIIIIAINRNVNTSN